MTVTLRTARDTTGRPDAPDTDHVVDAAGFDSFPASDPPGWWSGPEPTPAPHEEEEGTRWS